MFLILVDGGLCALKQLAYAPDQYLDVMSIAFNKESALKIREWIEKESGKIATIVETESIKA